MTAASGGGGLMLSGVDAGLLGPHALTLTTTRRARIRAASHGADRANQLAFGSMKIVLALVITLGLAACGKKSEVDEFISKMDGFKTKICACKDTACLDGVHKEQEEWMKKFEEKADKKKDVKPTEAQEKKMDAIEKETNACEEKLEAADAKGQAEAYMKEMNGFADAMCACKDMECANGVNDKMTKWSEEQTKKEGRAPKFDDATMKQMTDVATRLGECNAKLMTPPATP
jgi:hypothetical protein